MDGGLSGYLIVLLVGISLTVVIGQILIRSGQAMLAGDGADARAAESRSAESISRLVGVLFHLVALGVLAMVASVDVAADGAVEVIVTRIGVVLLVLGAMTAATIGVLGMIRGRRVEQRLAEATTAAYEARRATQP